MATQKYCYIIVHESKGTLFIENYRMPFFWNKKVAENRCMEFKKQIVKKILFSDLMELISKTSIKS